MTDSQTPADPEVRPKVQRRKFAKKYKLDILRRVDQCDPGDVGALLRREGLYTTHITRWKEERENGRLDVPSSKKASSTKDPIAKRLKALGAENRALRRQFNRANTVIDVQKNFAIFWA